MRLAWLLHPLFRLKRLGSRHRRFRRTVAQHLSGGPHPVATEFPIARHQRSDTLFVLGSGASILDLTPEHWRTLRQHDTLAFSFWLYHEFVPTYFAFEIPKLAPHTTALFDLLARRASDYADVPIIFNDLSMADERCPDWPRQMPRAGLRQFYALHNVGVPGYTVPAFERWLRCYDALGVFEPRPALWYLPKKRASLSLAVAFALLGGYRRLVFCGVDLKGGYFYEAPAYRRPGWPVIEAPRHAQHSTVVVERRRLPIDAVLCAMQRALLARRGFDLRVAFSSSGLYPRLPCFFG